MKKNLFLAILALGVQTVGAQNFVPQQAQTIIYVKPEGTGNGSSWAQACDLEHAVGNKSAVGVGFTPTPPQIWVQKGTYYPSEMLIIPDSVKMFGGFSGTETDLSQRDFAGNPTIIDAQKKFGSVVRLSPFAELNGFTIQNGNAQRSPHKNGGGIWLDDYSMAENCVIINNSASINGGGIYAKGSVKVENCTIENNTASDEGANVYGNCISGLSAPIINKHPNTIAQSKSVGAAFPALSVSVAGNAPYSYQWYSNTANNNTSGTPIQGATGVSYTPPSTTVGTSYYYCEVTDLSGTVVSNVSGAHAVFTSCNSGTFNFGTVSFASATTRTITGIVDGQPITQVWSAAVVASGCNKTAFNGGSSGNYNADCRSNPSYPGSLFSWCAVTRYAATLCPAPWRVPSEQDFVNLDKAMGGNGANRSGSAVLGELSRYVGTGANQWGGAYGGQAYANVYYNVNATYGNTTFYMSQTDRGSQDNYVALMLYSKGWLYPAVGYAKTHGGTLRCVR